MDIFFPDPDDPQLPLEQVRLRDLRLEPSPDCTRVKVFLELTPFQQRPSADLVLTGPHGAEITRTAILEAFNPRMELNLHLPPASPPGDYTLQVTLYYQPLPQAGGPAATLPAPLIVDRRQSQFHIPIP